MNLSKFVHYSNTGKYIIVLGVCILAFAIKNYTYGSGFSYNLEMECIPDTSQTDYGKQQEAREESKGSDNHTFSTDENGAQHVYKDGCEVS